MLPCVDFVACAAAWRTRCSLLGFGHRGAASGALRGTREYTTPLVTGVACGARWERVVVGKTRVVWEGGQCVPPPSYRRLPADGHPAAHGNTGGARRPAARMKNEWRPPSTRAE